MPSNRSQVHREEKIAEILELAERRLREGGYDALSVAAIARELKIAPNSIYWYFPSKDELFVAAVAHLLQGIVSRKPSGRRGVERRVLWFVEQLDEVEHLRVALYDRARSSPVVARFATELDEASRQMLTNALDGHIAADDLHVAADALLATIQGAGLRGLRGAERRRVVTYALRRFGPPTV